MHAEYFHSQTDVQFQVAIVNLVFHFALQGAEQFFDECVFQVHGFTKRRQHVFRYGHVFRCQRIVVVNFVQFRRVFEIALYDVSDIGIVRYVREIDLGNFVVRQESETADR